MCMCSHQWKKTSHLLSLEGKTNICCFFTVHDFGLEMERKREKVFFSSPDILFVGPFPFFLLHIRLTTFTISSYSFFFSFGSCLTMHLIINIILIQMMMIILFHFFCFDEITIYHHHLHWIYYLLATSTSVIGTFIQNSADNDDNVKFHVFFYFIIVNGVDIYYYSFCTPVFFHSINFLFFFLYFTFSFGCRKTFCKHMMWWWRWWWWWKTLFFLLVPQRCQYCFVMFLFISF